LSLKERIEKLTGKATPLSGEMYRSAAPKYATTADLVTGEGSRRFGGRWNPPGVSAVYGSFTPQTALEETLAHSHYYSLPLNTSMPRTFVAIEFSLTAVFDITVGKLRQSLGISEKRLLDCDWRAEVDAGRTPITQAVGDAAFQAGLEAILVRSAADSSGTNLVVFTSNLDASSALKIVSPDRLGT